MQTLQNVENIVDTPQKMVDSNGFSNGPMQAEENVPIPAISTQNEIEKEEIDILHRLAYVPPNYYSNFEAFPDYGPLDAKDTRTRKEKAKDFGKATMEYFKSPRNIWDTLILLMVVCSGALLVMVLFSFPFTNGWPEEKKQYWVEVCSQTLNACFTYWAIINTFPRVKALSQYSGMREAWKNADYERYDDLRVKFQKGPPLWSTHLASDPDASRASMAIPLPAIPEKVEGGRRRSSVQLTSPVPMDYADVSGAHGVHLILPESTTQISLAEQYPVPVPHSWLLWMLVLLTLNVVLQIPITFAMWYWAASYNTRPSWIVALFLPFAFLSVFVAYAWLYLYDWKWNKARRAFYSSSGV